MNTVKPDKTALERFKPFMDEILQLHADKIDSLHLVGSALTTDFDPKQSDINSVLVLKQMELKFLENLARLGKKFGKKQISAPLIMTPAYVAGSLDVFPIEFLNIQLIHHTLFGPDLFADIDIKPADLRYQCERELKVKLIGLRQGYIASAANRKALTDAFISSFSGYIPLFRGIIVLMAEAAPIDNSAVITTLKDVSGVDTAPFLTLLEEKKARSKLSMETLNTLFEDCYGVIEKLGDITDEIDV